MNTEHMEEAYAKAKWLRDGCKKLTKREVEIIKLLSTGLTHEEAGKKLGLSKRTVSAHNYNIFKKIGAKNIVDAINHVNKHYGR